jgi:hypothetical protein
MTRAKLSVSEYLPPDPLALRAKNRGEEAMLEPSRPYVRPYRQPKKFVFFVF